jgi:hypothetical protein
LLVEEGCGVAQVEHRRQSLLKSFQGKIDAQAEPAVNILVATREFLRD